MPSLSDHSPYSLILVDSMNMAGRMDWIDLSFDGHRTGMLYGFAKFVLETKVKWPGARIIFLWEGSNQWRRRKYPFYKAKRNRGGDPGAFFSRVNAVRKFLTHLPVDQATVEGFEADDLAGWFVNSEPGRILLVSKDQDWWQFVTRDNVEVQYANQLKTRKDITADLGYAPETMGVYKALKGDASDNIPGVERFPSKLARMIAVHTARNGGGPQEVVDAAVAYCEETGNHNWARRLDNSLDVVTANMELTVCDPSHIDPSDIEWVEGRPDETAAINALLRNGMENLSERYQKEWELVGRK